MLGIGRTHFENVRNHLAANGIIPRRVYSNVKKVPRWKTKITIDKTVATAVKNFLENYAETHGLPSPGRNVNRITQSLTLLPAETSYKSVYRNFISGLENDIVKILFVPQVMTPINTLYSNYESTNRFM